MADKLFTFGVVTYDATKHILAPTYAVNDQAVYTEWVDGLGKVHRDVRHSKLSGSFEMLFYTRSEFNTFMTALEAVKTSGDYYTVSLYSNNMRTFRSAECFIEIEPTIRKESERQQYEPVTVTVEERYA